MRSDARLPLTPYRGKRLLDVAAAGGGLLILSPFLLLLALLIRWSDHGPALFRQRRVGLGGREFRIWKFRTMIQDADRLGSALTGHRDPRITPVGRWLRRFKLDELPQLVNVLRGEMSLVGPRPEVPKYVATYSLADRAVLDLRPGLTDPTSLLLWNEAELLAASPTPELLYVRRLLPWKIAAALRYAGQASLASDVAVVAATILGRPGLLRLAGIDVGPPPRRTSACRRRTNDGLDEAARLRAVYAQYAQDDAVRSRWGDSPGNRLMLEERDAAVAGLLRKAGWLPYRGGRVLEVGCGAGRNLALLASLGVPVTALHGVDLMPDRVAQARTRLPGAWLECADATALPFEAGEFEVVLLFTVMSSILGPRRRSTAGGGGATGDPAGRARRRRRGLV
ncbi:MAG: sugar transferase [Gemmatimonadetes bacterium]|nr:sugar transferase [Gemmatimonadota bacterium]